MKRLSDLEKKINSELTTKIKSSKLNHDQIYLNIENDDLLETILFLKNNNETKFKQLIDITAVDYPDQKQRSDGKYGRIKRTFRVLTHFIACH